MSFSKAKLKELEALETEDTKYCSDCKKILPLFEFSTHSTGRKCAQAYCILCGNERSRKTRIEKYGITIKQYDLMFEKQGGRCKICGTKTPKGTGRFHIDHAHGSGKIRGLLCNNCNVALGLMKDDIKILASMIQYLENSRKQ